MPTIVVAEIPHSEFALQHTFDELPDLEVESERVVANGEDIVVPLVWLGGADEDELEHALEGDPSVHDFSQLTWYEDEGLYQLTWAQHVHLIVRIVTNERSTIMELYGTQSGWRVRVLFPDRDELSNVNGFCDERDLTFDIKRIRDLESAPSGRYGLTDEQYESLRKAWEAGYFDVPREIDLRELADELGISHQAFSERLRRGHSNLIEETIGIGPPGNE